MHCPFMDAYSWMLFFSVKIRVCEAVRSYVLQDKAESRISHHKKEVLNFHFEETGTFTIDRL